MTASERGKTATLNRIANSVFQLEEARGHLKWTVSGLALKAKVSRSLIYQYLGSAKKEILIAAVRHFTAEFYGLGGTAQSLSFGERIAKARALMIEFPEAVVFYQKWRSRKSWLQSEFIAVEKQFQKELKVSWPDANREQLLAIHAVVHGLVTAPFLSVAEAENLALNLVNRIADV